MRARVAVVVVSCRSDDYHNSLIFVPAESASERRRCKREFKRQTNLRLWVYDPDTSSKPSHDTPLSIRRYPGFRKCCNAEYRSYAPAEASIVQYSIGSHLRHDGSAHVRGRHRGPQAMEHLNQTLTHARLELGPVPRDLDFAVCVPRIA